MIIGHQNQQRKLQALLKKNQIPHAFLFSGPEKIGKRKVVSWFLKMINCSNGKDDGPCNCCRSCLEIKEKTHTDMVWVSPEKKEIYLEQIEEVINKVSYKGSKAVFKGVLIDDAHLMNPYAQNALLKVLEEPPKDTLFFLVTSYPSILLPTVISRLFELKFSTVPEGDIEKSLRNSEVSSLSFERPGIAIEYLRFPEKKERAEKLKSDIEEIFEKDMAFRFSKVKEIVKEERAKDFLEYLLKVMQEGMKGELREKASTKKTREALTEIQETLFLRSKTNINVQLALEKIMLKI